MLTVQFAAVSHIIETRARKTTTRPLPKRNAIEPREIHPGGYTRRDFDRGFEGTRVATRAFCRRSDASVISILSFETTMLFLRTIISSRILFIFSLLSQIPSDKTTKREERKRRETHSAGSLHGLGHDFVSFFCVLLGFKRFGACACVFKK